MNARWIIPFVVLGGAWPVSCWGAAFRSSRNSELVPAAVSLALLLANFTSN
jgi:hypothetical protein